MTKLTEYEIEWLATHCTSCKKEFTQQEIDFGRCSCGHMICAFHQEEAEAFFGRLDEFINERL
jgi:rRNA maturation endonuclease Nob1